MVIKLCGSITFYFLFQSFQHQSGERGGELQKGKQSNRHIGVLWKALFENYEGLEKYIGTQLWVQWKLFYDFNVSTI